MKSLPILFLAVFACMPAHANAPKKAPLVKYTGLWTNSPFTSKPPPPPPGETVNPFEDFTLAGISPVPGGYRITIISKKNPDIRKVIEPGGGGEFKVVSVERNPEKSLGTTVVLSSGAIQGTVSFEPELITLNAAPRIPRPRIVPPATPNANQQQQQPQGGTKGGNSRRDIRRR